MILLPNILSFYIISRILTFSNRFFFQFINDKNVYSFKKIKIMKIEYMVHHKYLFLLEFKKSLATSHKHFYERSKFKF